MNVSVDETIYIICQTINQPKDVTPFTIPGDILHQLLCTYTSEAPFYEPNKMHFQNDSVAMGSPLGPLFANFCIGAIIKIIFNLWRCYWSRG